MAAKLLTLSPPGGKPVARKEAARRLRVARHKIGMTQEDVAALCGTTRRTVGARERGDVDLGPLEQLVALELEAGRKRAA
jgi:DNA-binding XRE family transcriptional regulator